MSLLHLFEIKKYSKEPPKMSEFVPYWVKILPHIKGYGN